MTQCTLVKDRTTQVSWIPTEFAKLNKVLKVEEDEGWVVTEIGGTLSKEMVKAQEKRSRSDKNFRSTK